MHVRARSGTHDRVCVCVRNVGRARSCHDFAFVYARSLSFMRDHLSVIRAAHSRCESPTLALARALRSGVGKFAWPRGYVFVSNDLCRQMGRARVKVSCWALSMTAIDGTLECASRKNAASGGIRILGCRFESSYRECRCELHTYSSLEYFCTHKPSIYESLLYNNIYLKKGTSEIKAISFLMQKQRRNGNIKR